VWTPAASEHAPAALPERRVLQLRETSLPYLASGDGHRTATVLRMQMQAGLEPVACTRLGFPASRGYHRHPYLENVGGVPHHRLGLPGVTRYTAVPPDERLDVNAALDAEHAAARPPAV
jgi:D-inositol-3-phosphate glycosyltransferase